METNSKQVSQNIKTVKKLAKFKVLKKNEAFLNRISIHLDASSNPTNNCLALLTGYYILIVMLIGLIISGAPIFTYLSDIKSVLGALKICIAVIQCGGIFFGVKLKVTETKALQSELQQIVNSVSDADDGSEEHHIYWECEQKCRKHTQGLSYYVFFHTLLFPIALIHAFVCIVSGNYDTSLWHLGFDVVVPYDQTCVWGWFLTLFIQFLMAFSYALCMTTVTSLFVSGCYYIYAMCDHFNVIMNSVERTVERMRTVVEPRKIRETRQQIDSQLSNAIRVQIKVYEIFHLLTDISSFAIFSLLPPNSILMSLCMYEIEVSFTNLETSILLLDVSCLLCALIWPVILCHFASHTTDRVSSIGDMVYNANWFEFPTELQKYAILTIARSQQPVYFTGLGIVNCSLEVFGKLCKTSSSYYIMFRTLGRR